MTFARTKPAISSSMEVTMLCPRIAAHMVRAARGSTDARRRYLSLARQSAELVLEKIKIAELQLQIQQREPKDIAS